MSLLSRKELLAIAIVVDLALQTAGRPMSSKTLAVRNGLPARHLESVLQALVHDGILKGTRGPRGGYELARERNRMTINDILRATRTDDGPKEEPNSGLLEKVVMPVLAVAEQEFAHALNRIDFEDMTRRAERLHQDDGWDTAA